MESGKLAGWFKINAHPKKLIELADKSAHHLLYDSHIFDSLKQNKHPKFEKICKRISKSGKKFQINTRQKLRAKVLGGNFDTRPVLGVFMMMIQKQGPAVIQIASKSATNPIMMITMIAASCLFLDETMRSTLTDQVSQFASMFNTQSAQVQTDLAQNTEVDQPVETSSRLYDEHPPPPKFNFMI